MEYNERQKDDGKALKDGHFDGDFERAHKGSLGIGEGRRGLLGQGTLRMSEALEWAGHEIVTQAFFDTVRIKPIGKSAQEVVADALARGINLRDFGDGTVCVALDETVEPEDVVEGGRGPVCCRGDRSIRTCRI